MRSADHEPRRGSGSARPLAGLAGALLLAASVTALSGTADAATGRPAGTTGGTRSHGHLAHPDLDWAGSTLRRHERPAAAPAGGQHGGAEDRAQQPAPGRAVDPYRDPVRAAEAGLPPLLAPLLSQVLGPMGAPTGSRAATAPAETAPAGPTAQSAPTAQSTPTAAAAPTAAGDATAATTQTQGLDVSAHQGTVDWAAARRKGAQFAYVKATESDSYTNPHFTQQYDGSYQAGLIRGAYHFATPDTSPGTAQADYFVAHGGGWSRDGRTLPPILDIEYNPYGAECYGKSKTQMVAWIRDFVNEVHRRTTRWPTLYTSTGWWSACTGNSRAFAARDPLFVARYSSEVGTLPAGWPTYTFWQYSDSGPLPGDQDRFNGTLSRVRALANNS